VGSSLITIIVSAPDKAPTKAQLKKLRSRLEKIYADLEKCTESEEAAPEYLVDILANTGLDDLTELHGWVPGPEEIEGLCNNVARMGSGGEDSPRDTNWAVIDGRRIIVAGDSTWGDSPDGTGYRTLEVLEQCNLLGVLGWRQR